LLPPARQWQKTVILSCVLGKIRVDGCITIARGEILTPGTDISVCAGALSLPGAKLAAYAL